MRKPEQTEAAMLGAGADPKTLGSRGIRRRRVEPPPRATAFSDRGTAIVAHADRHGGR
jgi:hypothetical protein